MSVGGGWGVGGGGWWWWLRVTLVLSFGLSQAEQYAKRSLTLRYMLAFLPGTLLKSLCWRFHGLYDVLTKDRIQFVPKTMI